MPRRNQQSQLHHLCTQPPDKKNNSYTRFRAVKQRSHCMSLVFYCYDPASQVCSTLFLCFIFRIKRFWHHAHWAHSRAKQIFTWGLTLGAKMTSSSSVSSRGHFLGLSSVAAMQRFHRYFSSAHRAFEITHSSSFLQKRLHCWAQHCNVLFSRTRQRILLYEIFQRLNMSLLKPEYSNAFF